MTKSTKSLKKMAIFIAIIAIFFTHQLNAQNIGINVDEPHNSAILEVYSIDKGVLIPRLTDQERNDIPHPATGLIIYNKNFNEFNFWDGNNWVKINDSFVSDNVGTGEASGKGLSINMTGANSDKSAMLDINSDGEDKKGLLIPRTTIDEVITPTAEGLLIYNTDANTLSFYDGTNWQNFCHENITDATGSGSFTFDGTWINDETVVDYEPNASSIVDISSNECGFLLPRLTDEQRNSIISPADGLMIYNTSNKSIDFFSGSEWRKLMHDVPQQPNPIIGNSNICENSTDETFSITEVQGATSYTWTVPSDANITNGQGSTSITVDFGTSSGNICVTANNGCGSSFSECLLITISNPTASISGDTEICDEESTTLTASGGTNYNWSTGNTNSSITVSTAGAYTVTVTDSNSCTAETSETVTVHSNPTASISGDNEICDGESTTLTASGGTNYNWSTGNTNSSITVSTAGTYTVTVTDSNSCTAEASETVTVHSNPTASISGDNEICDGESTTLTASGGTNYNWSTGSASNSITVSTAGTYTATVTDSNSCTAEASETVTVHSNPTATAASNSPVAEGEDIELTSSGGISYSWDGPDGFSNNNQNPIISDATTDMTGTYSVTVTDDNGCTATASTEVEVEQGWKCGEDVSYQGYDYATVEIGDQCWFAENLRYLPSVIGSSTTSDTEPYYYVYGYEGTNVATAINEDNYDTYGVLYNWPAAMNWDGEGDLPEEGSQGLCPDGWHIPTDNDWKILMGEVDTNYDYPDDEWMKLLL